MNYLKIILFFFIASSFLLPSCVEPTDIGKELLEDDFIGHGYLDDFEIHSRTEKSDSLKTYFKFSPISSFYVGNMIDQFYGTVKTSFVLEAGLFRTGAGSITNSPNFKNVTLDSVVLVLRVNKGKTYGFVDETFTLNFDELDTRLNNAEALYSNFEVDLNPFKGLEEQYSYYPRVEQQTTINYTNTRNYDIEPDTIKFNHIRFPLGRDFGLRLMSQDSSTYLLDSTFVDFFKGVMISSSSRNGGIFALDKISQGSSASVAGIYVYFSNTAQQQAQYQYTFNDFRVQAAKYSHDYKHSMVEPFLENPTLGDSISFIQGLAGLNTVVTFPNLDQLQGKIINRAELRVNIAKLPGDSPFFNPPVEQLVAYYRNDEGELQEINDYVFSRTLTAVQFGGVIIKGENGEPDYYTLNISNHLQEMAEGNVPNEIYLGCFNAAQVPNRVALYGGTHSQNQMKLKVNFTDPK